MFEFIISFILGVLAISTGYYVYTSIKIRKSYLIMRKRFEGLKQHNNERYADMTTYVLHSKQWNKDLEEKIENLDLKNIDELKDMIGDVKKAVEKNKEDIKTQSFTNRDIFKGLNTMNGKLNSLREDPKFLNRY